MEKKMFTIDDMKLAFMAGMQYEAEVNLFDINEIDEVTELDFGDFMKTKFDIEID